MKTSQRLWRGLFFIFLITALCGGLVLPAIENAPARAAPQMQATACTGTTITYWDFTGLTTSPAIGSGTLRVGPSLPAPAVNGSEVLFDGWAPTLNLSEKYLDLVVSTAGRNSIGVTFDYSASSNGPTTLELYYSTDGTTFAPFGSPTTLTNDDTFRSLPFGLSAITDLDNKANAIFRLYPYGATDQNGTLKLDNITITGNCISTPTPTALVLPQQILINEVAWAGTAASTSDEWIELYNQGFNPVDLTGWTLRADDNSPNISLNGRIIPPGGFLLLERTDDSTVSDIVADLIYTGELNNSNEVLRLRNASNTVVDTANSNGGSWPAGSSATFGSMERRAGTVDSDTAWITNTGAVRNGLDANSNVIVGTPKNANWANLVTPTVPVTPTNTFTNTPTNTSTAIVTATPTNTSSGSAASVVISEFRTRGPRGANDEFIELYNPTAAIIDISGWKINASNDAGGTGTRATIPTSTLLRSGQYYLVANSATNDGYNNPGVPPNLTYGTGISDNGGIALLRTDNVIVDQVGMHTGSAYKEGTILAPLTENSDRSYERKPGGTADGCQDTNNNANDFLTRSPSNPHNYSSQLSRCGTLLPIPIFTQTTITSDTPDPSLVNGNVTVSVRVTGGTPIPSGTVNITGANTNCTITLNASGTGSCTVRFTATGTKTLTATYVGDQRHLASSDTETHQVSTSIRTPTPTRVATLPPPPPLLVINEFVPRPGHDWNLDGVINVDDEYIEILNHGVIDVNLNGYSLDDEVNLGSTPFRLPSDVTLKPGERRVFYGSQTGLLLSDGGDGVRLLRPNGQLMDAYNYRVVRFPDQSYCRLPDNGGADDWNQNCFPTPGLQNSLSGSAVNPPTAGDAENLCPIADTLPADFLFAECLPFGNNIWNPAYWDKFGWYDEKNLPESPGKWPVFVD